MRSSSQAPARPNWATASICSGVTSGSPSRATALRARKAQRSRRPPPMITTAARTIQTADLGSENQFRPGLARDPPPGPSGRRGESPAPTASDVPPACADSGSALLRCRIMISRD